MTDDEWKEHRDRAISAAFRTGRPVFADNSGELHFADGDREAVSADDAEPPQPPQPQPSVHARAMRASRFAFVVSVVTAALNMVVGFWRPWHFAYAAVLLCSALVWRYVHRKQRALC